MLTDELKERVKEIQEDLPRLIYETMKFLTQHCAPETMISNAGAGLGIAFGLSTLSMIDMDVREDFIFKSVLAAAYELTKKTQDELKAEQTKGETPE